MWRRYAAIRSLSHRARNRQNRLVLAIAPEGGRTAYGYDGKSNLISITATPKPGSPLAPLVTATGYDPIFNKPVLTVAFRRRTQSLK